MRVLCFIGRNRTTRRYNLTYDAVNNRPDNSSGINLSNESNTMTSTSLFQQHQHPEQEELFVHNNCNSGGNHHSTTTSLISCPFTRHTASNCGANTINSNINNNATDATVVDNVPLTIAPTNNFNNTNEHSSNNYWKNNHNPNNSNGDHQNNIRRKRRKTLLAPTSPDEIRFAKLMLFLSISFVICWMPQMVCYVLIYTYFHIYLLS